MNGDFAKAQTPNFFSPEETSCRCGCGFDIRPEMLAKLNWIREEWGKPILISSGARCPDHNRACGGAKRSAHMEGIAADLVSQPGLKRFIIERLDRFGVWMEDPSKTVGWLHLDLRPRPNRIFQP